MARLGFSLMTVVFLVITFFAALTLNRIHVSDDHQLFLKSDNSQYTGYLKFKESYPLEQREVHVIVQGELLSPAALQSLYQASSELRQLEEVANVATFLNVPWVNRKARAIVQGDLQALPQLIDKLSIAEYLPARLVSDDLGTTLLTVTLHGNTIESKQVLLPAIKKIRQVLVATAGQQLSFKLAGFPSLREALVKQISKDSITFGMFGLLLSTIAAFFIFRSWQLVMVSVVGPAVAIVWITALMVVGHISINSLNQMVFVLVLVITYADSVHLTMHINKLTIAGNSFFYTVKNTLKVVVPACFMTSVTTAVGFASLLLSDSYLVKQFGLLCAAGAITGFLVMLLCTPMMVFLIQKNSCVSGAGSLRLQLPASRKYDRIAIVIGVAMSLWFLFTALQLRPGYTMGENLPADNEFRQASQLADQKLGGVLPLHLMINWHSGSSVSDSKKLRDIRKVQRLLRQNTDYQWVSIVDLLRFSSGINSVTRLELLPSDVVSRLYNKENSNALISASIGIAGTGELNEQFQRLQGVLIDIEQQVPEISIELSGLLPLLNSSSQLMINDLLKSLVTTFVVVSLLLLILFQSWRLSVLLLLPNFAPIAAVASVLVWSNTPLQFSSVIVFSICLGIVVDDSIHFVHRFLHYRRSGLDNNSAVSKTQAETGQVLMMSTVILVSGLSALIGGSNPTVALIGTLLIVALLVALVFDLIMLPALLRQCYKEKRAG